MTVLRRLVRVDERAERLELAAAVQVDKDRVEAGELGEVSGSPRVHRVPLERREPPARLVDERRGEVHADGASGCLREQAGGHAVSTAHLQHRVRLAHAVRYRIAVLAPVLGDDDLCAPRDEPDVAPVPSARIVSLACIVREAVQAGPASALRCRRTPRPLPASALAEDVADGDRRHERSRRDGSSDGCAVHREPLCGETRRARRREREDRGAKEIKNFTTRCLAQHWARDWRALALTQVHH